MDQFHNELLASYRTGFIDHSIASKKEYLADLLINDKLHGRKVLTSIIHELRECSEFEISVAFVTKSGVAVLINHLKELQQRNVPGKLLVSQYQNFTQPEALRSLLQFPNINLRIAVDDDFHAKGYLFKRKLGYNLIIGSSNLTASALSTNKEWNLKIVGDQNGQLISNAIELFRREFDGATPVDLDFIKDYEERFYKRIQYFNNYKQRVETLHLDAIQPNSMQVEALDNLRELRKQNKARALLISATGTGKTYLSAFDAKAFNPKRLLFIVHRENIAATALKSFRRVFGDGRSMGLYSGHQREVHCEFLFCTIQTISRDFHLQQFAPDQFDYIVIDETHRAGAESYQKVLGHLKPKFLLGMTATPERTDGFDIFKQFQYNIAYEIRLHRALEEQMLSPFHYYGVTDVSVDGKAIDDDAAFNLLVAEERVNKIIEYANFYGTDSGVVRGLVFCSKVDECKALSKEFNLRGYKTVALTGANSEAERALAISQLESDDVNTRLQYIFTVDIFNEGVDIPKLNQVIMLRPTQSAIVFVQQLGRGLRKIEGKDYLTVIDFIGNYSNNYMLPIALFGDTSYNKDSLRKLLSSGSSQIPGSSTINFDPISLQRIFTSIDSANLSRRADLDKDYALLKFKIGRMPMMLDFLEHGSRDPKLYVEYAKSYFNYVAQKEPQLAQLLTPSGKRFLELFSKHIADAKRIEEVIIMKELLYSGEISSSLLRNIFSNTYGTEVSDATIRSCRTNLNFEFVDKPEKVVLIVDDVFKLESDFAAELQNPVFKKFLSDLLSYALETYNQLFRKDHYLGGFLLYQKYSRKDVCRILNWDRDEHSTIFGYKVRNGTCPIFVNYHKEDHIADTTKYEDQFISNYEFQWMSRSRRTTSSGEIQAINGGDLRLSLFVKKSNDEGNDFYYMGEVLPLKMEDSTMEDGKGNRVSVVRVLFKMITPVEDSIFNYLTSPLGEL